MCVYDSNLIILFDYIDPFDLYFSWFHRNVVYGDNVPLHQLHTVRGVQWTMQFTGVWLWQFYLYTWTQSVQR